MRIRFGKSQISKKCVVCDARTTGSKIYEEGDISIRIPICERDDNNCHEKVFVKDSARDMLRQLKTEVTQ